MHENGSQPLGIPPSPWPVSIESRNSPHFLLSAAIVRFQVSMRLSLGPATHSESIPCYDGIWHSWLLSVEISAVIARFCPPSKFTRAK